MNLGRKVRNQKLVRSDDLLFLSDDLTFFFEVMTF